MIKIDKQNAAIQVLDDIRYRHVSDVALYLAGAGKSKTVLVHFDSNGGSSAAGRRLEQAFREHGKCIGVVDRAFSAAAVALVGCAIRVGRPGCKVMLHVTSMVDQATGRTLSDAELSDQSRQKIFLSDHENAMVIATALGKTRGDVLGWIRNTTTDSEMPSGNSTYQDRVFDVAQAIKAGFLHGQDHSPANASHDIRRELLEIKFRNTRQGKIRGGYQMFQNGEWVPCEKPKLVDWTAQVQSRDSFGKMLMARMMQGSGTRADVLLSRGNFPIF